MKSYLGLIPISAKARSRQNRMTILCIVLAVLMVSWSICGLLHYGIGGEFETMPVFALSPVGLVCGVLTVLLAALVSVVGPSRRMRKMAVTETIGEL